MNSIKKRPAHNNAGLFSGLALPKAAKTSRMSLIPVKSLYSAYYYCPNCREMYYSEDFKIKTFDRKENYKNQGSLLDHIIKENQD